MAATDIPTKKKDPDANLDYTIDWSRWLLSSGGDQIDTSEWTVPSPLVKGSESTTPQKVSVFIAGGVVNRSYVVTNRIVTVGGRTNEQSFRLVIEEK